MTLKFCVLLLFAAPICGALERHCCTVPEVKMGKVESGNNSTVGAIRTFNCEGEHYLKGSNEIECSPCGVWEVRGYCEEPRFDCKKLPNVGNGQLISEPAKGKHSYRIECNPGYAVCSNNPVTTQCSAEHGFSKHGVCVNTAPNSAYFVVNATGPMDWDAAVKVCASKNARLAHITSGEQNQLVDAALGSDRRRPRCEGLFNGMWIGGFAFRETDTDRELNYRWDNGPNITNAFEYWSPHEPNNIGCNGKTSTRMCLQLYPYNRRWDDIPCDDTYAFGAICEKLVC